MYVVHYCYAIYEIYVLTGRERSEGLVSDGTGEGGVLYILYIYRTSPFPDFSSNNNIMLARSKQIKEEKAEAARASLASSSDGSYALRKKRGKEDIPEV